MFVCSVQNLKQTWPLIPGYSLDSVGPTVHHAQRKDSPVLTSINWFFTTKDPPTHSHTKRRNTPAAHVVCAWEKSRKDKKKHQSLLCDSPLYKQLIVTFSFFPLKIKPTQWFHFSQIPLGLSGFHMCFAETLVSCTDKLLHALMPIKDNWKEQPILHIISMAS